MGITITRIMFVTLTLMSLMVNTIRAEGTPSVTLSMSCTIPEVPGLNAPLREEAGGVQLPEGTTDKTIVAASDQTADALAPQDEELIEDAGNYNTVLRTVYRR